MERCVRSFKGVARQYVGLISKYFPNHLTIDWFCAIMLLEKKNNNKGETIMKHFIERRSVKTVVAAVIGFLCGLIVDSAIFGIKPLICCVVEATLLSVVYYATSVKEWRRM